MVEEMQIGRIVEPLLPTLLFVLSGLTAIIALQSNPRLHVVFFVPAMGLAWSSIATLGKSSHSWVPESFTFCQGLTSFFQLLWLPLLLLGPGSITKDEYNYSQTVRDSTRPGPSINVQSFIKAYRQWNNPRRLPPCKFRKQQPVIFVVDRLFKCFALNLINYIIVQPFSDSVMSRAMLVDFAPESESFIRRLPLYNMDSTLDIEQFGVRAMVSLHWLWHDLLVLESCHSALAVLFVAILQVDAPEEWPPLYGSVLSAWSIKGLWGRYWHTIMTATYSVYARNFSRSICGAAPGSWLDKTLVALGIFAISGAGHSVVNWQRGEVAVGRDLLFYLLNFAAIGFEVLISKVARAYMTKATYEGIARSWFTRLVGYCWVCLWLIWIVPRWVFPRIYHDWITAGLD